MCNFFSCVSNGEGEVFYFDYKTRRKILTERMDYYSDSHTSIADWFGFKGQREDALNKYEYNPLTRIFKIDQLNTKDDTEKVKSFCEKLDFKSVVPELIVKPPIDPFQVTTKLPKTEYVESLKEWASIRDSVRTSLEDHGWTILEYISQSVESSAGYSVRESIWDLVVVSIGVSVMDSICTSACASVEDSVWASFRESIWDSVAAYISSFFNIDKFDYSSAVKLWENGIVPSFDGSIWRLHTRDGVIFEVEKDKLQ